MILPLVLLTSLGADPEFRVGAKAFTESLVLAEMAAFLGEQEGLSVTAQELGGTRFVWEALKAGDIDCYPEYTGTLRQEIFSNELLPDEDALRDRLAAEGIRMTQPLGFNNTYALGMKSEVARRLGIRKISDLKEHPGLRFGFSSEFLDRSDGWPSLKVKYDLPHDNAIGMEHALTYRAIDAGDIHITDLYATDANILFYDLATLQDDLGHFPNYDAIFLYREDLQQKSPELIRAVRRLEGRISDDKMLRLNQRVELNNVPERVAAAEFLNKEFGLAIEVVAESRAVRIAKRTSEHLFLVIVSLSAAIVIAVPLGVIAAKNRLAGLLILCIAEVIQTIPGLALLIFMGAAFVAVGLRMIGAWPVIVALFAYSLLPIIRNTLAGITDVPGTLKESAAALGLPPFARLRLIELPLASRTIIAGIKTTAVINVGYAALGGLVGAGGYGQPIMTGLRLNRLDLMMEGAIPAACLALLVKACFEYLERFVVANAWSSPKRKLSNAAIILIVSSAIL